MCLPDQCFICRKIDHLAKSCPRRRPSTVSQAQQRPALGRRRKGAVAGKEGGAGGRKREGGRRDGDGKRGSKGRKGERVGGGVAMRERSSSIRQVQISQGFRILSLDIIILSFG